MKPRINRWRLLPRRRRIPRSIAREYGLVLRVSCAAPIDICGNAVALERTKPRRITPEIKERCLRESLARYERLRREREELLEERLGKELTEAFDREYELLSGCSADSSERPATI
ncbi:hypothetical protein ACFL59_01270 [Planctomycetota bacterium]